LDVRKVVISQETYIIVVMSDEILPNFIETCLEACIRSIWGTINETDDNLGRVTCAEEELTVIVVEGLGLRDGEDLMGVQHNPTSYPSISIAP